MENLSTIDILENLISFPTVSKDANIGLIEYVNKLVGMGLPYNLATPYLSQMLHNSIESSKALTGPINRGDSKTIKKHSA